MDDFHIQDLEHSQLVGSLGSTTDTDHIEEDPHISEMCSSPADANT